MIGSGTKVSNSKVTGNTAKSELSNGLARPAVTFVVPQNRQTHMSMNARATVSAVMLLTGVASDQQVK